MDSSFKMDFILRDWLPRRSGACCEIKRSQHTWVSNDVVAEDKEERMLPDSSLSPSNQNLLGNMMDESKLSDSECVNKSCDKRKMAKVSECSRRYRVLADGRGEQYLVAEEHIVPLVGHDKTHIDNAEPQQSHDDTTTTTNYCASDLIKVESQEEAPVGEMRHDGEILESFLYASQLALVEVKLKDLEKELTNLDKYCFSKFVNSASNLKKISEQTFLPRVDFAGTSSFMAIDPEINERDAARRLRLRQIIKKHSDLKRWLSKIKRKLKEKGVSKLCHIVDFSSKEQSQLPLPEYIETYASTARGTLSGPGHEVMWTSKPRSDGRERSRAERSKQVEDENGNIVEVEQACPANVKALSKDGSDPDSLPHLTYEYENSRDLDANYSRTKCNSEDQVASTDSECQHNRSPPTPDLRRAELDCNDISENIRVLVVQKDYLKAGVIHLTNSEDSDQKLWRVTFDCDRKCQDIVISEWQLLEQGVREVIPTSINQLAPGSRVCANWSEQLPMNLYPGTITISSVDHFTCLTKLPIDFDDGDHKDVDLDQVRLLPENFPNLHELMKASHFEDSNFYSLDRKNRVRKKRVVRQSTVNYGGTCVTANPRDKNGLGERKKTLTKSDKKKKKVVVHWKLIKKCETSADVYELVRNIDSICIKGGDNVQLLSYSRHNYMANVVSVLARHQSSIMEIEFNWYYILSDVQDNSDIIKRLKKSAISKKVIFKTSHSDVNDVYSVLRKVEVMAFEEYEVKYLGARGRKDAPSDSYVMAGRYDQARTRVESLDEGIRRYILSGHGD